jgi:hypothetical protein
VNYVKFKPFLGHILPESYEVRLIKHARIHPIHGIQVLVSWEGYSEETWEPLEEFIDDDGNGALARFLQSAEWMENGAAHEYVRLATWY